MEPGRFFDDMAEDFFAECDELLSLVRRNLFRIDELKDTAIPDRSVMEELLRSSHTLKGLTGMIGAGDIMRLTHSIENYLKAVYEGNLLIPPEALDIIISGFNMIERQLAAFREKSSMPDMTLVLSRIESLLPVSDIDKIKDRNTADIIRSGSAEEHDDHTRKEIHLEEGEKLWNFLFTPEKELFERGININTVRKRLQEIGRVIGSAPRTGENGVITFEFTIISDKPESLFSSWKSDGITYQTAPEESILDSPDTSKDEINASKPDTIEQEAHKTVQKNIVRVDLSRLDDIMKTVGDLVVSRSRLNDHLASLAGTYQEIDSSGLQETNILMERQLRSLRENIMKLRLVPVGEAFERMKFVVRDLLRESNKTISIQMEGQDTHIDKYIIERMFEPLLHLVRNSVSHGIETAEERASAGKNASARILLKASAAGDLVIFTVEDDGRGINRKGILGKAVAQGIIDQELKADDNAILNIMCTPGFTTRDQSDLTSGRGIGMDVVKKTVSELGGTISFESEEGKMTRFTIQLPLTLSIVDALIVRSGNSVFAIPMPAVNEVARISHSQLVNAGNIEMFSYRDMVLPLIRLDRYFNISNSGGEFFDVLIVGKGIERVAIAIDKIIGKREIVVRSLMDPLVKVEGIYGATELGDARIVLILDAQALVNSAISKNTTVNTTGI